MKKFLSLFVATLFSVVMFADAEGGTLSSSPALTDPSATVLLTYDGAGTNFAAWEPKCFIHAWLVAADGQNFSKAYETEWIDCNGDAQYESIAANRKMTYAGVKDQHDGKYTISMNIKEFFGVADEDLAKIAQLGVIVCSQYNGKEDEKDKNKTKELYLAVGEGGSDAKTKDLKLVPGVWNADGAVLAAWAWKIGSEGAWAKFEGSEDPLVAKIAEDADSVIFVRFKDGEAIDWKSTVWNKTDNMLIEDCGIFFVNDWNKYSWCKADEGGEEAKTKDLKLVPGVWNADGAVLAAWAWKIGSEGAWAKFEGTEAPLVAKIAEDADSVIFVRFKDGEAIDWKSTVWNKTGNMLIEDCGIFYVNDWDKYSWCKADEGGEGGGGEEAKTKDLKLVPGVWTTDGAVLAVWAWSKDAEGAFAKFAGEGDTLVAKINEKADSVIFVRFKDGVEPTWEDQETNIWNKTADMKIEDCGIFYVNDWDEYSWCEAAPACGEGEESRLADGFYLITEALEWKVENLTADLIFEKNPGAENEFMKKTRLAEGAKIKVVKVEADKAAKWYPDGEGTEYVVDAAHAGDVTIYFQEESKSDWEEFGGFFFIAVESGEGIDNTVVEAVAVKTIENGMLIIEKAGVRYNVMGQVIR